MKTIVELALLSVLFISSVNAHASLEQWYVHLEANPLKSSIFTQVDLFLSFYSLHVLGFQCGRTIFVRGALNRDLHRTAQICCTHGNQDLSATC